MKLVDKDALVAEIKKRIKECDKLADAAADNNLHSTLEANELLIRQYTSLLNFLDTLEVKEVDETIKTAEDHAYFAGSENTREKLIDKACDWLRIELVNFEDYIGMGETFIEDFKTYMKGE